jgi:nicotinamide mononucleotide transporter
LNSSEILEWTGFVTGIAGVWLTARKNIWCFPVGLANVTISLFLFFDQKLYSDVVQQGFYIVLLSYGWYRWATGKTDRASDVSFMTYGERWFALLFILIMALSMGSFFHYFTDADLPYLDATATSVSFVAQYLIARKKIENWFLWIIVNLMYIGIYFYKDLDLYVVLFLIYLSLAVAGWISWNKSLAARKMIEIGK